MSTDVGIVATDHLYVTGASPERNAAVLLALR
jgi:hypothetical protein